MERVGQLPVDLPACGWVKGVVKGRGSFTLPAVLNDSCHALGIKRAFEQDRLSALNQSRKGLLKRDGAEVGGSNEKG